MQSPLQQILQEVQPGITLYGVLLTFAIVSFAVGRHFWNYEKELITENFDRLRNLLVGFRARYIEPKINQEVDSAIDGAYEAAIAGLLADLYEQVPNERGEYQRQLIDDELIRELVVEDALRQRLTSLKASRPSEMFLSSTSGQKLLADLDHMYEQKSVLARHYSRARHACGHTCYACVFFSLLALLGILRVLRPWPEVVVFFWLFLAIFAVTYAIVSFARLEYHRRKLLRMWEEFEFYGTI